MGTVHTISTTITYDSRRKTRFTRLVRDTWVRFDRVSTVTGTSKDRSFHCRVPRVLSTRRTGKTSRQGVDDRAREANDSSFRSGSRETQTRRRTTGEVQRKVSGRKKDETSSLLGGV